MGSGWQDSFLCRRPLSRVRGVVGGRTASFWPPTSSLGCLTLAHIAELRVKSRVLQSPGIGVCIGLEPCTNLLGNSLLTAGLGNFT